MDYNSHTIPMIKNRPPGIAEHDSDWYITFTVNQYCFGVETKAPTIKEYNDFLTSFI